MASTAGEGDSFFLSGGGCFLWSQLSPCMTDHGAEQPQHMAGCRCSGLLLLLIGLWGPHLLLQLQLCAVSILVEGGPAEIGAGVLESGFPVRPCRTNSAVQLRRRVLSKAQPSEPMLASVTLQLPLTSPV